MYDVIFYERRLCRQSGLLIRYIDQATSWNTENIVVIFFIKTASPALGFRACDTLSMEGWMNPGSGLDFEGKRKSCSHSD